MKINNRASKRSSDLWTRIKEVMRRKCDTSAEIKTKWIWKWSNHNKMHEAMWEKSTKKILSYKSFFIADSLRVVDVEKIFGKKMTSLIVNSTELFVYTWIDILKLYFLHMKNQIPKMIIWSKSIHSLLLKKIRRNVRWIGYEFSMNNAFSLSSDITEQMITSLCVLKTMRIWRKYRSVNTLKSLNWKCFTVLNQIL